MKKMGRLALINLLVFVALMAAIELFFYSMLSAGILQPRHADYPQFKRRTTKDVIAQYGENAFEINSKVSAEKTYDWKLNQLGGPGTRVIKEYDPSYYKDYNYNNNQNKTHGVKTYLESSSGRTLIYEMNYGYNELGLRRNMVRQQDKKQKKFVATVGCSFTFGEGVPDGLDYPSQLAEKVSQDYRVFNFGHSGDGLNDLYARTIYYPKVYDPPSLEEGIVIWLFIPGHFDRFFCHYDCIKNNLEWIFHKPRIVEKDGQLVIDGQVSDMTRPYNRLVKLLSYSYLLKYMNPAIGAEYSQAELHTFAHTYADLAFNQLKPNAKKQVYLVNFTRSPQQEEFFKELKSFGIQVLDYSDIPFGKFSQRTRIPLDTHPTSELYSMLSNLIYQDIFLKKKSP